MSGRFKGVQSRVQEKFPAAVYIHCASHCLNLTLSKASQVRCSFDWIIVKLNLLMLIKIQDWFYSPLCCNGIRSDQFHKRIGRPEICFSTNLWIRRSKKFEDILCHTLGRPTRINFDIHAFVRKCVRLFGYYFNVGRHQNCFKGKVFPGCTTKLGNHCFIACFIESFGTHVESVEVNMIFAFYIRVQFCMSWQYNSVYRSLQAVNTDLVRALDQIKCVCLVYKLNAF